MGNVNININGTSSGGGGGMNPPSPPNIPPTPPTTPTPPSGGSVPPSSISPAAQPDSRLVEEVRRAIISQGAVFVPGNNTYKPILNQVEQTQRKRIDDEITSKYEERRAGIEEQREDIIVTKIAEYNAKREQELQGVTNKRRIQQINDKWDALSDAEIDKLVKPLDKQLDQLDQEEQQERLAKQDELTQVMKELTDAINKSGTLNPDSYLGQLRMQRQEAIFERDTAEDEESAKEAAQRVRDIDQQIKDVTDGRVEESGIDWGARTIQTMMGFDQIARGIAGRDIGSVIMGGTQSLTSIMGASDETAAKALAWIKPIATVGTLLTQEGQRSDQMAGLAALLRGNKSFEEFYQNATPGGEGFYEALWNYSAGNANDTSDIINPYGIAAMGMDVPTFAQSAERRISQRMSAKDGVSEAYFQEALERVFSLNRGSLGEAGKYDRYGTNITDAISSLVKQLETMQGSGVSRGNYVRVHEYLGAQQGMMEYYKRFADRPDYLLANVDVAGAARIGARDKRYTFDDRSVSDIQATYRQLTNPQNDRLKSILYSTVEEAVPEYKGQTVAGRSDLIDQILNDPKYMSQIRSAYMQRLTDMYGGPNDPLGYWMVKSQLGDITQAGRRAAIWEGYLPGGVGTTMGAGEVLRTDSGHYACSQKEEYSQEVANYVSGVTKALIDMSDALYSSVDKVNGFMGRITRAIEKGSMWELIKPW